MRPKLVVVFTVGIAVMLAVFAWSNFGGASPSVDATPEVLPSYKFEGQLEKELGAVAQLQQEGKTAEAIDVCNELTKKYADQKDSLAYVLTTRAMAESDMKAWEKCFDDLDKAMKLFPDSPKRLKERAVLACVVADIYGQGGRYHQARDVLCSVLPGYRSDEATPEGRREVERTLMHYLMRSFVIVGEEKQGLEFFDALSQKYGEGLGASSLYQSAILLASSGDFGRAASTLKRLAETLPEDDYFYGLIKDTIQPLMKWEQKWVNYKKASRKSPAKTNLDRSVPTVPGS